MTVWAILSDVHGRGDRLAHVLADARAQGATQVLSLGDVGGVDAIERLDGVGTLHAFGNWEASGLRGLPHPHRSAVASWPARYETDGFWAAHATPVWPAGLDAAGVVGYLRERELHWSDLFPSLARSPEARWAAFAELEAAGVSLFFHGHTHLQEVWRWLPDGAPALVQLTAFHTQPNGSRWLVGVGSVGEPQDGEGSCYALYDDARHRVTLRRLDRTLTGSLHRGRGTTEET